MRMSQAAKSPVRFGSLSARFRVGFGSASVLFSEISVRVSQAAKLPVRFRLAFGSLSARFRFAFGSLLVRFRLGFGSLLARFWLAFSCTEPSQVHFWFTFGSLLLGADRCRFTFGSLSARSWLSFGPSGSSFGSLSVRFRLAFGSVLEYFSLGRTFLLEIFFPDSEFSASRL